MVSLGKKTPDFGLSRWNGNGGLRFVPSDDEGFSLRGDKRRLVYKGRRRSHRFTILGDSAFEYDCILEKEPENNVIALAMEGAEQFDFFRQPDSLKEPLLAGSYAVYKKETLLGEGTGKLCHIHRPEIIDARGRRCWGDLSIRGNMLCITVPEEWLGEAKYPVVVDPTIGTTTVGKQTHWDNVDNESYDQLFFEYQIAVNRYLFLHTFSGTATAYVYAYESDSSGVCKPVLYTDRGNAPLTRRSSAEGNFDIAITKSKPAGWRSTTFQTNAGIAGGTYVWFGFASEWFAPRFDFGAKCYTDFIEDYSMVIPETYPVWDADHYRNFKLSMYFTYSLAQNYTRTLTQGVTLSDTRKMRGRYKRTTKQSVRANGTASRFAGLRRKCFVIARNVMTAKRYPAFMRKAVEKIKVAMRNPVNRSLTRNCSERIQARSELLRYQSFFRAVWDNIKCPDDLSCPVLFVRFNSDKTIVSYNVRDTAEYARKLETRAFASGDTSHKGEYRRASAETIQAGGSVFRGLLLFIRVVTGVFIRDYLLRRFLKAREELRLKSCICGEVILNSKII